MTLRLLHVHSSFLTIGSHHIRLCILGNFFDIGNGGQVEANAEFLNCVWEKGYR